MSSDQMPAPGKTKLIKFPPSRAGKDVKCPGYARGGCWSFDLTDTLLRTQGHWFVSVDCVFPPAPLLICNTLIQCFFNGVLRYGNRLFWINKKINKRYKSKISGSLCWCRLTVTIIILSLIIIPKLNSIIHFIFVFDLSLVNEPYHSIA